MKYLVRSDKQNKGRTVAAALSFHKPPENKVYKFLCHGWIHNTWPVMKLKTMWISSKYPTKHHENSYIYELMQLISNSPIATIEILFSHLHFFLDLLLLLTSYPTKNCVFWVVLLCFTSQEVLLLFQTQLTEHWGSSEVTKCHPLPLAWRTEEQPEQALAKLTPQHPWQATEVTTPLR